MSGFTAVGVDTCEDVDWNAAAWSWRVRGACWHLALESDELAGEGLFHIRRCVQDGNVAGGDGYGSRGETVRVVILEMKLVGYGFGLEVNVVGDHGVEVELAVGSVGGLQRLIDVVFDYSGGKGHAAVDGKVDRH